MAIAEKYLIPTAMKASGLSEGDLTITRDGIESLIKHYCREAGVRNLQKHVEKIFRKAAVRKVRGELPPGGLVVDAANLAEFVGKPIFTTDRLYDQTPVGVVMGLAWTNMGTAARRDRARRGAARHRCLRRLLARGLLVFGQAARRCTLRPRSRTKAAAATASRPA